VRGVLWLLSWYGLSRLLAKDCGFEVCPPPVTIAKKQVGPFRAHAGQRGLAAPLGVGHAHVLRSPSTSLGSYLVRLRRLKYFKLTSTSPITLNPLPLRSFSVPPKILNLCHQNVAQRRPKMGPSKPEKVFRCCLRLRRYRW
jgi:hypothetical protein